jgi:hypothetical protein
LVLIRIALKSIYPEHEVVWKGYRYHWRQSKDYKPYGFWRDIQQQRLFFDQLATKLNITKPTDWYKINSKQADAAGAGSIIKKYYSGSLIRGTIHYY